MKIFTKKAIKITAGSIFIGLVTSAIWDLIKSQPFFSTLVSVSRFLWFQLILLLNQDVKVYWALIAVITVALGYLVIEKIMRKVLNTKIGNHTFRQLHMILRTEHIRNSNSAIVSRDFSQFSILDIFIATHCRLAAGINLNSDLFLYHDVCPVLFLFDLMDRKDTTHKDIDLITHHYTLNNNGKLFWSVLSNLSIPNRMKDEKIKELQNKLQKQTTTQS